MARRAPGIWRPLALSPILVGDTLGGLKGGASWDSKRGCGWVRARPGVEKLF